MAKKRKEDWERQAEKIWKILDRVSKEQREFVKEMRQLRKSQERLKESQERLEKSQERLEKSQERLEKSQEKTDQQINKLIKTEEKRDEAWNKLKYGLDKLKDRVEGISMGFGRITVGMTLPCVAKAFSEVGIEVFGTEERVKRRDKKIGEEIEIDILSVANKNGKQIVILMECATYLREKDVKNFIKKTSKFYHFFPEHKDKEFICAVGYIHAESRAIQLAKEQNYYLVSIGENVMEIKNKEITPKIYYYQQGR